ncbi:hypothetical protein FKM82_028603 [Ascaphus truei]
MFLFEFDLFGLNVLVCFNTSLLFLIYWSLFICKEMPSSSVYKTATSKSQHHFVSFVCLLENNSLILIQGHGNVNITSIFIPNFPKIIF